MNKTAVFEASAEDAKYRALAEQHLAEINLMLKRLAQERKEHARRQAPAPNLLAEVRAFCRER